MVETIISVSFLILSLILYTQTGSLPESKYDALGPAAFPRILLITMALLSLVLTVSNVKKIKERKNLKMNEFFIEYRYVLTLIGLFLLYVLSIKYIGFLICNVVFLSISQWILSPKKKKYIPIILTLSLTITFGAYFFFTNYLNVIFPQGIFFE